MKLTEVFDFAVANQSKFELKPCKHCGDLIDIDSTKLTKVWICKDCYEKLYKDKVKDNNLMSD